MGCRLFIFSEPKKRRGTCLGQGPIGASYIFISIFVLDFSMLFGHALRLLILLIGVFSLRGLYGTLITGNLSSV